MRHWISFPRSEGLTSRQAHADLPPGSYERELGREGFFGPATQMYHAHPPTGWIDWDGPLRPRAFDLNKVAPAGDDPWRATTVLHNARLQLRFWRAKGCMPDLVRNADGDELLFVHRGCGALFCDYGRLVLEASDYVVLPRGTLWRCEFDGAAELLLIEATGDSYRLPDRGPVGAHAVFDPAVLDTPALDEIFRAQQTPPGAEEIWRVRIKRRGVISTATYPFNPLDALGWHGDLAPIRLKLRDIRPLMSHRYHLPPSAHSTFVAERFVVCSFVPRPFESDPGALKVPFFHNNDDFDEAIFYHRGDFFSRDDIGEGMLTFHPSGFTHGPHPKALAGMLHPHRGETDEYAVMIDARDPLEVGALPAEVELPDYVNSWRGQPDAQAAE
jgi:homogentisate 1,2-dioxygenase